MKDVVDLLIKNKVYNLYIQEKMFRKVCNNGKYSTKFTMNNSMLDKKNPIIIMYGSI